jgi:hypothetical protein
MMVFWKHMMFQRSENVGEGQYLRIFRGPFLVEDLAMIYVMVGKYDDAIKQKNIFFQFRDFFRLKSLSWIPPGGPH